MRVLNSRVVTSLPQGYRGIIDDFMDPATPLGQAFRERRARIYENLGGEEQMTEIAKDLVNDLVCLQMLTGGQWARMAKYEPVDTGGLGQMLGKKHSLSRLLGIAPQPKRGKTLADVMRRTA